MPASVVFGAATTTHIAGKKRVPLMALRSKAFSGDDKLEAAAAADAGHIVQGARGEHVRKLQQALIALDGAKIDPDGVYGGATAAAVLAYKRKRNIINRLYQTQADNIVGKMTMEVLDKEMLEQEQSAVITSETTRCDFQRPPGRKVAV